MAGSTAGSVSSSVGRHTRNGGHGSHRHRQHWHHQPTAAFSEHEPDHLHRGHGGTSSPAPQRISSRSQSLSALQPAIMQPRMARLETLEAKMASIEVSLSAGNSVLGRRRKGTASPGPRSTIANKENNTSTPTTRGGPTRLRPQAPQNNTPQNSAPSQIQAITSTTETRERNKEFRNKEIRRLTQEADSKRLTLKNIRIALDMIDITDNIDVRIRQAELEYQLGREELNLLTVTEEIRRLQCQEEEERERRHIGLVHPQRGGGDGSLHCVVKARGGRAELGAVEAHWDRSGPRFGTVNEGCGPGILVEWAAEGADLRRGDRLLEVNGRAASPAWTREDLARSLASRPSPARLVILRAAKQTETNHTEPSAPQAMEVSALRQELGVVRAGAEEAKRAKDGLRADNLRLTHRISYLEEQVQELLDRRDVKPQSVLPKTPVQIPPCVTSVIELGSGEVVQVYQKNGSRSVRSLDLEADYASEPSPARPHHPRGSHHRPQPPKKPLRLSLHRRAQSLQSVDDTDCSLSVTPIPQGEPPARKRTHRGECPQGALRWTTPSNHAPTRTRPQGNKWC